MKKLVIEVVFFVVMSAIILPTPTLIFAHMTGKTWREVVYR